jgi:hypothetical protein
MLLKKEDFDNQYKWGEFLGNYAEKRFEEECSKRNLVSAKPVGLQEYDSIVEIKDDFKRVQIKSVTLKKNQKIHDIPICVQNKTTGKRVFYTKDEIDYFAVYLFENDCMYLIPSSIMLKFLTKHVRVYDSDFYTPHHSKTAIDIKKYKNW